MTNNFLLNFVHQPRAHLTAQRALASLLFMKKFLLLTVSLSMSFTSCSKRQDKPAEPKVSQFNNCSKELVKEKSYCAFKIWWGSGIATSNLLEVKFQDNCTAQYSFHAVHSDDSVSQVTCGSADWGFTEGHLIIDPNDHTWVGRQNLGNIIEDGDKFTLEKNSDVVFESPCPYSTKNWMCP